MFALKGALGGPHPNTLNSALIILFQVSRNRESGAEGEAMALCNRLHYPAIDAQGSPSRGRRLQRANEDDHVSDFFDSRQTADQ
jgi:hypothetical protein